MDGFPNIRENYLASLKSGKKVSRVRALFRYDDAVIFDLFEVIGHALHIQIVDLKGRANFIYLF